MRFKWMLLVIEIIVALTQVVAADEIFKATGIYVENPKPTISAPETILTPPKPVQAKTVRDYSAYSPWYVNGRNTDNAHLISDHGVTPNELVGLSQDQKNRLHGKLHGERPRAMVASKCPGGVCPVPIQRPSRVFKFWR